MIVIVDTNIIFSALRSRNSKLRSILLNPDYTFYAPNFIIKVFSSADYFDDKVIFNIGGNKYRLIVKPQFKIKTFFIKAIYTHKEYDKGKWKK